MTERTGHARRLGLELLVIVAGVLIALAAQAAVEEWSDRQREQAFLADLLSEFRVNETRLLEDIETSDRARLAAELWRAAAAGSAALTTDSASALYAASLNTARFDPISGSLRSLIDGGDLGLIRNRELRAALAGWSDRTEEHRLTTVTVDFTRSVLTQSLIREDRAFPEQALRLDRLFLQVLVEQQAALLDPLREIISLLEAEVRR